MARRIFSLLRDFVRSPAAVRLIMLVLRQTGESFSRVLSKLLVDLGMDSNHRQRAVAQLQSLLDQLTASGVIKEFTLNESNDRLAITLNSRWHEEEKRA